MRSLPDINTLKTLFDYDPITGVLRWRARGSKKWDSRYAGTVAGTQTHKGYVQVAINKKLFFAHRIAYAWMTDEQPEHVDHVDGDGLNNKWLNLRAATVSQNLMNRRVVAGANKFKGVYRKGKRFVAQIKKDKRHTYIGMFATAKEAAEAYDKTAMELHGEFAATNKQLGLL